MYMNKLKKSRRYYKKIIRSGYTSTWKANISSKDIKSGKIKLILGEDNSVYLYASNKMIASIGYDIFRMTQWGQKE